MKISVKQRILYHLNGKDWVHKASLEQMSREWNVLADNIDRRARELVNDGLIERQKVGKTVQYRIKNQAMFYTPIFIEPENTKLFELPTKRRYT